MDIYVQFSDEKQTLIVSIFSCAQDPEIWPNQGIVDESDPRYKDYWNGMDMLTRMGMPTPS
ncbi:hypothetical protein CBW22_07440 [Pantoea sp. VS1]|uniref:hypothetical protein n=1 Tax=Pantoea sp. VS1 TaxID=2003658 RepID=UPI000B4FDE4B|nr:hypothetical protein [Pantoea sp. VS1]OWS76287.1 hypothetical protein CBW22_07440 [Pantoea sp. VS1]